MNSSEIEAVRESWRTAQMDRDQFGLGFFLNMFEKFPHLQAYFTFLADKSISEAAENPQLKYHGRNFSKAIDDIVANLTDSAALSKVIDRVGAIHDGMGIPLTDYKNVSSFFVDYLTQHVGKSGLKYTPCEITAAWKKAVDALVDGSAKYFV